MLDSVCFPSKLREQLYTQKFWICVIKSNFKKCLYEIPQIYLDEDPSCIRSTIKSAKDRLNQISRTNLRTLYICLIYPRKSKKPDKSSENP